MADIGFAIFDKAATRASPDRIRNLSRRVACTLQSHVSRCQRARLRKVGASFWAVIYGPFSVRNRFQATRLLSRMSAQDGPY